MIQLVLIYILLGTLVYRYMRRDHSYRMHYRLSCEDYTITVALWPFIVLSLILERILKW